MTPAERAAESRHAQEDKDVEVVIDTPEGRRLLWRIIARWGGLFELSVDPDVRIAALLEGRRAVALALYRETQRVSPQQHALMVQEALADEQSDRALAEAEAKK